MKKLLLSIASVSGACSRSTGFASKVMIASIVAMLATLSTASAGTETFITPTGATTSGGGVNSEAILTFSLNTVSITLENLRNNPTDVAQALSALSFTISPPLTSGTLTSSSGIPISIAGNGTYTESAAISTGWILSNSGATFKLDDLSAGGAGPSNLIIGGPGSGNTYSNGNGSIDGNNPHNPFLLDSATYTLSISGVTANTDISSAVFQFGTTDGSNTVSAIQALPDPSSWTLALVAVSLFAYLRMRTHRAQI